MAEKNEIQSLLSRIADLEKENLLLRNHSKKGGNEFDSKDLIELIPEIIFEIDLDGKIHYINQKGLEKFGYSHKEFNDDFSIRTFFPEDHTAIEKNMEKLLRGVPFEKQAYWASKKNGEKIPVIASTTLVKKNNIPYAIRGVLVDISEQSELQERFKTLFENSPFATVIFDPYSGKIYQSNPKSKELFSTKRLDLDEKNIFFYVQDNNEITFRNYIKNIGSNPTEKDSYETTVINEADVEFNVKITSSNINILGNPYIQCIFQDITELVRNKKQEIEQRKQKELLALSVFQLNKYKDKDSIFKYIAQTLCAFNPKSVVIMGDYIKERNSIIANHIEGFELKKISDLLKQDMSKAEFKVIDYATPQNRMFVDIEAMFTDSNFYSTISKKELTLIKKLLGVNKLYTSKLHIGTEIIGGIAVFTPNENFLSENEFIEIFIAQAEIMLDRITYEERLVEAKENAIESDRLKSAFLSNMSHEIRTPMNSILGFSSLILNEDVTEELKNKYAALIQNSGDILIKLIDDIIDISKIESNQLNISQEEFYVNEIIEELEIEYQGLQLEQRPDVEMNFQYMDNNVEIRSDRSRIKQILNNLVNNSTKFTKRGSVDVWYELNDQNINFHVKDTGIGIPKEKQEIIFDRFRQADETSTRPFRGAGLGLAISKHIAHMLGGDILVSSHKHVGTEFIVSLPTNSNKKDKPQKNYIKPHQKLSTSWPGKTVYIAEDEKSNFLLLEAYLSISGIEIEWFCNGADLIKAVNKKQPDIILLDLKMPEMDGYTAAFKIKSKFSNVPIIAQTAYAMANEKERAMEMGCDDFITKPVKKDILLYKLGKFLNS